MEAVITKTRTLVTTKETAERSLKNYSFLLLHNVNQILEIVIRNTLQLNKFTTIDEIRENIHMVTVDTPSIEDICDTLSQNDGLLIKYIHKDKVSYRLNSKVYM